MTWAPRDQRSLLKNKPNFGTLPPRVVGDRTMITKEVEAKQHEQRALDDLPPPYTELPAQHEPAISPMIVEPGPEIPRDYSNMPGPSTAHYQEFSPLTMPVPRINAPYPPEPKQHLSEPKKHPSDHPKPSSSALPSSGLLQRFDPIVIPSHSALLPDGFPSQFPAPAMNSHGVSPADWSHFIFSIGQTVREQPDPSSQESAAQTLLTRWNEKFFIPRKLKVRLLPHWQESGGIEVQPQLAQEENSSVPTASSSSSPPTHEDGQPKGKDKKKDKEKKRKEKNKDKRGRSRSHSRERHGEHRSQHGNDFTHLSNPYSSHPQSPLRGPQEPIPGPEFPLALPRTFGAHPAPAPSPILQRQSPPSLPRLQSNVGSVATSAVSSPAQNHPLASLGQAHNMLNLFADRLSARMEEKIVKLEDNINKRAVSIQKKIDKGKLSIEQGAAKMQESQSRAMGRITSMSTKGKGKGKEREIPNLIPAASFGDASSSGAEVRNAAGDLPAMPTAGEISTPNVLRWELVVMCA
ncbi:hypothetical protein DL93DRAFT_2169411 [Clavulina sp. PMI_390]|nr:hypothetical protein DL93DRAFT_2169411 [Clavulina sp. PMI_390]